jgi:uroporphyrin-III C-methyltransferase / precorrin-2 dehydrogenase / sirohydrochlorin ferrochelatase
VVEGTTGGERTVRTTLADLGATITEESVRPPAVWVVGEVVGLLAPTG